MEQHLDLFAALAAPFEHDEVRIRPQGNQKLQYVTARTVMNRLDDVLGPSNWWDEYIPQEKSVICKLTIRLPDGSTLTKSDAGGYAGMSDQGDDDKSGFSDSFKRAAVKFGIGRYLYRDGMPRYVRDRLHAGAQQARERANGQHAPAHAEAAAPPQGDEGPAVHGAHGDGNGHAGAHGNGNGGGPMARPAGEGPTVPQSGKALFAWLKQQDEKHDYGLLRIVSDWAKRQDFPARMVEWDAAQVQLAFSEARDALKASRPAAKPAPVASRKEAEPAADGPPAGGKAAAGRDGGTAVASRSAPAARREREPAQPRASRSR
ncbi:Rad52/Rad22 family DNA repair protein [Aquisphaera giovannonii]|nr:Rad52/Rad22 family DNA repair protein [Aquisphaera giovannonii]